MTIVIEPIKIKESLYLRIPKSIADLVELDKTTKLALEIKKNGKTHVLEYRVQ